MSAKKTSMTKDISVFIVDRKLKRLSQNTIDYYSIELRLFSTWCEANAVTEVEEITPDVARRYLLDLGGHRNAGGVHAAWRSLKAFLNWYEREEEPENWKNPIKKVSPPKINTDPRPGVTLDDFDLLIRSCDKSYLGKRDRAIFYVLLDTGIRMAELCALDTGDVDTDSGRIVIKNGKGGKSRTVFVGAKTRKVLSVYIRENEGEGALFRTSVGNRFSGDGLRQMVINRSKKLGIEAPGLHDFRRTFTIESLRNGADILSISRQLGHSSVHLVQRYANQSTDDLSDVHDKTSPIDNI